MPSFRMISLTLQSRLSLFWGCPRDPSGHDNVERSSFSSPAVLVPREGLGLQIVEVSSHSEF